MELRPFLVGIVDDDPRVVESLEELLASAGYRVISFSSAEAFLEANGLQQVDCLVSDIGLPGISGWGLVQIVCTDRPKLPVILITARDEATSRPHSADRGALHLFRKPFDGGLFLRTLDQLLRSTSGG